MENCNDKKYGTGLLMGVFDLFHVGHLRLIRRARERCDYLRVAVLSDELVMKFKNKLPVIPLSERMEILGAIREVDEVVPILDTPSRLLEWERRPFDCFFSGDDYEGDPYWEWERKELRKRGFRLRDAKNEVREGIAATAVLIGSRAVKVHRKNCPCFLREIHAYLWDEKARQRGEERPVKDHDHAMDALRYLCHTLSSRFRRTP